MDETWPSGLNLLTIGTDGHYLNLPVMNEGGEIVGMVDVLKLTYATLEQVSVPGQMQETVLWARSSLLNTDQYHVDSGRRGSSLE